MRILNAHSDRDEWDAVIDALPEYARDVHFTSAYGRVQETQGGKAILLVDSDVAQPFLMQRVDGTDYYDLKNLYGYGGPVSHLPLADMLKVNGQAFRFNLAQWAKKNGVVSEYCTLHPLFPARQLPLVANDSVLFGKDVVVVDELDRFDESCCHHRVRKSIRKARDAGFRVIDAPDPDTFFRLYTNSMNRLGAAQRWRYELDYWRAHWENDVGSRWFFVPGHRALLTVGLGRTAYAHFLGDSGENRNKGLNELLYFTAAQELAKSGYKRFHLGGGLTGNPDDKLLFFKSGFSEHRYRVGTYRRIFMPEVYDQLSENAPRTDWFPAYRAVA
jgi:hypothetical protein